MATILPRLESAEDVDFHEWDISDKLIILTPEFQRVLDNMNIYAQAFSCIGLHDDYLQQLDSEASPAQGYGFVVAEVHPDETEKVLLAENRPNFSGLTKLVADTLAKIEATTGTEIRLYFLEPRRTRPEPPAEPEAAAAVMPKPKPPMITGAAAEELEQAA